MNGPHDFSDEQLTAYLDGEGEHELLRAIDAALLTDESLRNRIDRLTIPTGDIKSAFDGLLLSAPTYPSQLARPEAANQGWANVLRPVAATAAICLSLGWLASGYFTGVKADDWRQSVATYHALYVNETLAQVSQSTAAAQDELTRVMAVLGMTISPEILNGSPELVYKRAQVLGFEGRPLAQLAFLSKTGVPVALCIIKNGKPEDRTVSSGELLGMKTASWSKGNYEYLLVGGTDAALIDSAANGFSAKL